MHAPLRNPEATMDAKPFLATLLLAALAGCASTPPPQPVADASPRQSLRGVQCLDPAMARSWIDLDSNTLLVDAGRYKYRMEVSAACTAVDWSHTLVFRGDPVTGRVCGTLGDAIVTRDYPCTIRSLELLDKEQYKALVKEYEERRKGKRKPAS
jgi:hypothetical protein